MKKNFLREFVLILGLFTNSFFNFGQALSGTYTIGGVSPDFQTFTAAVSALNTNGIDDNVTFLIRTGDYIEQFVINQFNSANIGDKVVFTSESGNRDDVKLKHLHQTGSLNYTIAFNGGDHVEFKNMTIQALPLNSLSAGLNRVIYITGNSNNITFDNNIIKSWYASTNYVNHTHCVYIGADSNTSKDNDTIHFLNNEILGGLNGLSFEGLYLSSGIYGTSDILVKDNVFRNQSSNVLDIEFNTKTNIQNNKIYRYDNTVYSRAISISQLSDSILIDGNYIYMAKAGFGISVTSATVGTYGFKQISNNSIIMGSDTLNGGLNSNPIGIYCSNITDSILIAHNSINLLQTTSNGRCIHLNTNNEYRLYNNHFSNQGNGFCIFSPNGSISNFESDFNNFYSPNNTLASIGGIVYNSTMSLFSSFGNEEFSSSMNPMFLNDSLLIPFNSQVYNSGTSLVTVNTDFFGTTRSSITPDIGIFEGEIPQLDAGLIGTSLNSYTVCTGDSVPLYVSVKNFGISPLTSLSINYQINDGFVTSTNWFGALNQFDEEDSIFLGYGYFNGLVTPEYKFWSSNPNGQLDILNQNDTIAQFVNVSMAGIYTVGNTLTDFATINDAIAALISRGVCGPTTINILPGNYNEQLVITNIPGSSIVNTITIQSQNQDSTSVIYSYSATNTGNNFVFQLNGANYIRIKHLTLNSLGLSYKCAILCTNESSFNVFSNNQFTTSVANPSDNARLLSIYGNNNNYNTVENNYFLNGGNSIYIGVNYTSITNSIGTEVIKNKIVGSNGKVQFNHLINVLFKENELSSSGQVLFYGCTGDINIEKNKIFTSSTLRIDCLSFGVSNTVIKNNFLGITTELEGITNVQFINNSVNTVAPIQIGATVSDVLIVNNALNATGQVLTSYSNIAANNIDSDYNVLFTTSQAVMNGLNFSQWKSQTGNDLNSVFSQPVFVSNIDLHSNNSLVMDNSGFVLSNVTEDIDGETRNNNFPDIGADEFGLDLSDFYDVGINYVFSPDSSSCVLQDSIALSVINYGVFDIDTVTIKWWLFDVLQDSSIYFVNIPANDTIAITIQDFNFNSNTNYDMKFEISAPNGQIDNNFINNTLSQNYYHLGAVQIFESNDLWCGTNKELFIKKVTNDSILWSNGTTNNSIIINSPGIFSVVVTATNGCSVADTITIN